MIKSEGLIQRSTLRQKIHKVVGFLATGGYSSIDNSGHDRAQTPEIKYPYPGVYEHFKSTPEDPRLYYVIGCRPSFKNTLNNTDSDQVLVVYMPLYTDRDSTNSPTYYDRPVREFIGSIQLEDGREVPRFRRLEIE